MSEPRSYEVVVVGAGPAGLAAAFAASSRGKRVAIFDDNPAPGGQIWRATGDGKFSLPLRKWLKKIHGRQCEIISRATVVARPAPKTLLVDTPGGAMSVEFDKLILATGSRELFLPFPRWILPGIYGAGGLQSLVKSGLPVKGKNTVVAGSGPLLLAVADYLKKHGAQILTIAEQSPASRVYGFAGRLALHPGKLAQALALRSRLLNIPYDLGWWPAYAEGDEKLNAITLTNGKRERTFDCDLLACGFGLVPNTELPLLLGCELDGENVRVNEWQETTTAGIYCAGEPTGIAGAEAAIAQGHIAGHAAAGDETSARRYFRARRRWKKFGVSLGRAFTLRPELREMMADDTTICRCEDVTLRQLKKHGSWRDAKLQTRIGMGPCQGRICGAACRFMLGWRGESIRPPVLPVRADRLMPPPG